MRIVLIVLSAVSGPLAGDPLGDALARLRTAPAAERASAVKTVLKLEPGVGEVVARLEAGFRVEPIGAGWHLLAATDERGVARPFHLYVPESIQGKPAFDEDISVGVRRGEQEIVLEGHVPSFTPRLNYRRTAPTARRSVRVEGNTIRVQSRGVRGLRLWLSPDLCDPGPVRAILNGVAVGGEGADLDLAEILRRYAREADGGRAFTRVLVLRPCLHRREVNERPVEKPAYSFERGLTHVLRWE